MAPDNVRTRAVCVEFDKIAQLFYLTRKVRQSDLQCGFAARQNDCIEKALLAF